MLLRGLAVAASGFLFIFSPGLPIGLLARRGLPLKRDLLYWGAGLWLVMLLPSLFIQSLLRQILWRGQGPGNISGQLVDYPFTLLAAFITAVIVQGAMLLLLRRKRLDSNALPSSGLSLGFGVGLIAQIFTGLSLVGAGFRLVYGDTSTPTLASLAQMGYLSLILGLLPLILFRPALLVVSAVQGVLVGRALRERAYFFWLAVLIGTLFTWLILALEMALGSQNPGQVLLGVTDPRTSLVAILYYGLAFGLAFRWLHGQITIWGKVSSKKIKEK